MTFSFLPAVFFVAFGVLTGMACFHLLRLQVGALAGGRGAGASCVARLTVVPACFIWGALHGGAALLAMLAGFLAARSIALRHARRVWP